jgi:hypothetical protein
MASSGVSALLLLTEVSRPPLGAMHHRKDLYNFFAGTIRNNVTCCGHDQFTRSGNTASSSNQRELFQSSDRLIDCIYYSVCSRNASLVQIRIETQ